MGVPLLASGGDEQAICVWNVEQGQLLDELRGHAREIECLTFSPDGTLLASGSHDGLILLWEVDGSGHGRLRATLRGHRHIVRSVVFHPNGHLLASGSADGTVRSWDLRTCQTRQLYLSGDSESPKWPLIQTAGFLPASVRIGWCGCGRSRPVGRSKR